MTERDGGPAYPHIAADGHNDYRKGMSLRDWFAGQALIGILAGADDVHIGPRGAAKDAYYIADAMLAARTNTDKQGE